MPTQRRRRRRRHGSTALRRTPEQLRQQQRRRRIGLPELGACAAVVVICAAIIGLIWINTVRSSREQADLIRGRIEAMLTGEAATLAQETGRELAAIDQSLTILQSAWNTNPEKFEFATWRNILPVLTDVADDMFIANDKHLIVQDVLPQAVGQGIGSAYASFANGSLESINGGISSKSRDNSMLVGELGEGGVTRQYLMYIVRPLQQPQGWLIGASFRPTALTKLFAEAGLGKRGIAALIDTHRGGVQAVAGTAAVRPRLGLANTPLYKAIEARPDGGIWIGRTAIDGVDRIQAFRHVPGRDLVVLVGMERDDAMAPADALAFGARSVATMATLLVVAIGATVLWELWHWRSTRRRQRALAQSQSLLDAAQSDLATLRDQSVTQAAEVRMLLETSADGVVVLDGEQRVAAFNPRFAAACGIDAAAVHASLPLDDLVRLLVHAGRLGAIDDVEAAVAQHVVRLRAEPVVDLALTGLPSAASLRAFMLPDGGLLLIVRGADFAPLVLTAEPDETAATEEV